MVSVCVSVVTVVLFSPLRVVVSASVSLVMEAHDVVNAKMVTGERR